MHVTGLQLHRLHQQLVHQLDHGWRLSPLGQLAKVLVDLLQQLNALVRLATHQLIDRVTTDTQKLMYPTAQLAAASQNRGQTETTDRTELVQTLQIQRIRCGHHDMAVLPIQRQQRMTVNG